MIVPMKKVSLIVLKCEKEQALKKLRRLGLLHIEISDGSGERLDSLKEEISLLEGSLFTISERFGKNPPQKSIDDKEAIKLANEVVLLTEEEKICRNDASRLSSELERLKAWGEINPSELSALSEKGIDLSLYEMPPAEYKKSDIPAKILLLQKTKTAVRFLLISSDGETPDSIKPYKVTLPQASTHEIREKIANLHHRIEQINETLISYAEYKEGIKAAICNLQKETEFETYMSGMTDENLSSDEEKSVNVSYFSGYISNEDLPQLKAAARESSWGLTANEPKEDDDVPTKLKNNKFVSLVYPLTDFLGTVPGYFEFDISSWFLGFILVFFGIIFGDGGYGLLICTVSALLMAKSFKNKKPVPPAFLLVGLLGLSTVIWGTLTCTWFGLSPSQLPAWLKGLSVPVISNVNADRIWYPFWTNGKAGLTTAQNVQIFCFSLALVQLTAAHVKCLVRNCKSIRMLGDIGSILQLIGMFYIVLALVVNGEVFGFGLAINGIPIGITAVAFIGGGFVMSFIFSNYDGSIKKSILASLTNIVSVLLGVVNVFSDIVSYIRLWAVGLAGAAISATVNELAGPLIGNFMFIILAVFLLVFGHGLNMILNVLSVIVHGIRLNTLEFSSHLDMSWSGHKFKPFEE